MSIFVTSTAAPKPLTSTSTKVALTYAAVLVVMAVAQLFTFDEFLPFIQSIGLPFGDGTVYLLGPLIVLSEVFALPFLLRMWLSPAFRYVSMFLGWLVPALWLCVSLWIVQANSPVTTVGFLGTAVDLMPGWWAVFISLALGVLAAWSSWGLWPGKRAEK